MNQFAARQEEGEPMREEHSKYKLWRPQNVTLELWGSRCQNPGKELVQKCLYHVRESLRYRETYIAPIGQNRLVLFTFKMICGRGSNLRDVFYGRPQTAIWSEIWFDPDTKPNALSPFVCPLVCQRHHKGDPPLFDAVPQCAWDSPLNYERSSW